MGVVPPTDSPLTVVTSVEWQAFRCHFYRRYVPAARPDEGNAYLCLGEVFQRIGREDEARAAYETGIRQAGKFGHSGMVEDLRLALVELGGREPRAG